MTEPQGARLKQIRLQKGISLEEAHKKTKIHLTILKAIEEDNLVHVNPVYMRGFLKIYCNFLGADLREFIPDYKEPQGQMQLRSWEPEALPSARASFFKAVSQTLRSLGPRLKIKKALGIVAVIIVVVGLFNFGKFLASRRSRTTASVPAIAPVAVEKKATKPAAAKQEKATAVSAPAQETKTKRAEEPAHAAAVAPAGIRLIIRAKEDCYLKLSTDGHTVFQSTLKKGRFETWQAKEKIELSLGNAGAVALEVNGRTISSIGRRGQAVKNILITKDGLSIP